MTGYYLLDKPRAGPTKWYPTRRRPVRGVVVHVTAGLEDLDGGSDHSAENTAEYARTTSRAVSWHSGADTDTAIRLLPPSHTAFHCANHNSTTLGLEISKKHTDWAGMDPVWVRNTLANAAKAVADWWPVLYAEGIPLVKVTRAEWDAGEKGFISHAELDPGRRSDPGWVKDRGDTFPWQQFFDAIAAEVTPQQPPQQQEDEMFVIHPEGVNALFLVDGPKVTLFASGGDYLAFAEQHPHVKAWPCSRKQFDNFVAEGTHAP